MIQKKRDPLFSECAWWRSCVSMGPNAGPAGAVSFLFGAFLSALLGQATNHLARKWFSKASPQQPKNQLEASAEASKTSASRVGDPRGPSSTNRHIQSEPW